MGGSPSNEAEHPANKPPILIPTQPDRCGCLAPLLESDELAASEDAVYDCISAYTTSLEGASELSTRETQVLLLENKVQYLVSSFYPTSCHVGSLIPTTFCFYKCLHNDLSRSSSLFHFFSSRSNP